MARVHFVKKAAKAYKAAGIEKGDSYYWWQNFRGPKQMSKEKPKPSQVASSDYERGVLSAIESLETWQGPWEESDRDDLVSELEALMEEEQSKLDNMPEGLQQGDTGQLIQSRIDDLDNWIGELSIIEFPEDDGEEEDEKKVGVETPLEQALAAAPGV